MQLVVNSLLTNYKQAGNGPAVVLLHGWGDDSRTFDQIIKHLKNDYTFISVDLPGFGDSAAPESVWGLDDYADFVAAFIKKHGVKDVFAIIGHSNGGAIAIRGVGTNKLNPQRLILLASSGIRDEYKGRKKALRVVAKTAKAATYLLPKSIQNKLKRKAYKTIGSDMFVAEHLQDTFKKVVTDDVRQDCKNIKVPTTLIYGKDDEATPPRFGKIFHDLISNSQLHLIDRAAHFVHHDRSAKVISLIKEALK